MQLPSAGDLAAAAAEAAGPAPPEEEAEYAWLPPENIKPFTQVSVQSVWVSLIGKLGRLGLDRCRASVHMTAAVGLPFCSSPAEACLCWPPQPMQGDISGTGEPPVDPQLPLCIAAAERALVDDAMKKATGVAGGLAGCLHWRGANRFAARLQSRLLSPAQKQALMLFIAHSHWCCRPAARPVRSGERL